MNIALSNVKFVNDFAYIDCTNGGTLVLNKLDEDFYVRLNNINIAFIDVDNNYFNCNIAIGLSNSYLRLYTEHKEYEGKQLTAENIDLCFIEVFDE